MNRVSGTKKLNDQETLKAWNWIRSLVGATLVVAILLATAALSIWPAITGESALAQTRPQDKDSMVRELVTLDEEKKDLDVRISELENKSNSLELNMRSMEDQIEAKREKLVGKRDALSRKVRQIYVNGKASKVDLLFSSSDLSDFFRRSEFLNKMADHDAELIDEIKQESSQLEESLVEVKRRKNEVDELLGELTSRSKRLARNRSERENLMSRAGDNWEDVQAQSSKVEAKMEEINPGATHTGRFMTMAATAYSPEEPGLNDHTATGMKAQHGVVAVDPGVIPLGTRLYIEGYGYAIAGDTGSAIKGNRIDLCFDTLEEVLAYGWRIITVEILD